MLLLSEAEGRIVDVLESAVLLGLHGLLPGRPLSAGSALSPRAVRNTTLEFLLTADVARVVAEAVGKAIVIPSQCIRIQEQRHTWRMVVEMVVRCGAILI